MARSVSRFLTNEYISGLKGLEIKTRHILKGTMLGGHNSPFHGYSSEFSQYRPYTSGDDLKFFDWKIYGKSERMVVRQYKDETNTNIYLVLDSSASMDYKGSGSLTKMEYASVLTASLAMLAHRQGDRMSLIHGADTAHIQTTLRNTADNVRFILNFLETLKAEGITDLGALMEQLAPRLKSGSVSFLISDFWQDSDNIQAGLSQITHKCRATTLVQILTQDELDFLKHDNLEIRDLETKEKIKVSSNHLGQEYRETMAEHQFKIKSECSRRGIRYVLCTPNMPYTQAMRAILNVGREF